MTYITSIGTATPINKIPQMQIANFMAKAFDLDEQEAHHQQALYRASGIRYRYSVLEDYDRLDDFSFYSNTKGMEPFPSTKQRMEFFDQAALDLSLKAIKNCLSSLNKLELNQITHIISVSCTGMQAPGLDIKIVEALGLNSTITRSPVNFVGCYAAFTALEMAQAYCSLSPKNKTLIICTELSTLHFQKEKTEDNILANALFGDGSAAVLVENEAEGTFNFKLERFHSILSLYAQKEMAWKIGNHGFEMRLSAYVPDVIDKGISQMTQELFENTDIDINEIDYFAIHPGGKKILEVIEKHLNIDHQRNKLAHQVLKEYGNMSSATVLFVLQLLLQELKEEDDGSNVLSFAFGPGLTLEGLVLKIIRKKASTEHTIPKQNLSKPCSN